MRIGWIASVLCFVLGATARVAAQDADREFCAMLAVAPGEGLQRVGDVASGTTPARAVTVRRAVTAGAGYLVIVALSAAPTDASVTPVEIAGDEAPLREGARVALDFHARASGEVSLSFSAPAGTRYHAALYRLGPPRPGLGVRPAAMAIRGAAGVGSAGAFGSAAGTGSSTPPRPPDCRPSVPEHRGGPSTAPRAHVGRLVIRGSMPRAAITRVVNGALASFAFCAETNGVHDVTLRLVVAADGSVQTASSDAEPRLGGCLTRVARRWRFPSTGAGITAIDVPISFTTP